MAKDYKYTDSTPVDEPVDKKKRYAGGMSQDMGGVKDNEYRANKQREIAERQAAVDATNKAKADAKAKAVYEQSVRQYEREKILNPDGINKSLDKGFDNIGDAARSVGKFFGSKNMTSMDDTAQMQARKDVKGYAKGGSASSRADGCAQRGKTKGTVVAMNMGGMSC
jgi:hypothetical protein